MCLAVPSKIIEINNLMAKVDIFGAQKEVSLLLLPEEAKVGDYVLVHTGFAIQKITEEAALDSMDLRRQWADALAQNEDKYSSLSG